MKELDKKILGSCAERHVGLSAVLTEISEASRDVEPGSLRVKALATLTQLLDEGLIRAGKPTPDGKAFVAWSLSSKESLDRIKRDWEAAGPKPGDIVWFAATKEGVRILRG